MGQDPEELRTRDDRLPTLIHARVVGEVDSCDEEVDSSDEEVDNSDILPKKFLPMKLLQKKYRVQVSNLLNVSQLTFSPFQGLSSAFYQNSHLCSRIHCFCTPLAVIFSSIPQQKCCAKFSDTLTCYGIGTCFACSGSSKMCAGAPPAFHLR